MKRTNERCETCDGIPVVMAGLCRKCYTKKINRRVLDRLEQDFKPASPNNGFIFAKYLESTRARFVCDADIPLARKFATYLGANQIEPIRSWRDVFAIAKEINLHYVQRPQTGCPILQVGRHLDQLGLIPPLRNEKTTERSEQLKRLREPLKSWAKEFFGEVSVGNPAIYGLRTIATVRRWSDHLGQKPFAGALEEDAKAFIATLPEEKLAQAGHLIRQMKVFYNWMIEKSYVDTNPFENLRQPRVTRNCLSCGKVRIFCHSRTLCNHCDNHQRYSKKTNLLKLRAINLAPYSRNIFTLFVRYLHRYQIGSRHFHDAKIFITFLESKTTLKQLESWASVKKSSLELAAFATGHGGIKMGCPIIKVGLVLQELGVLPIREEGYVWDVNSKVTSLDQSIIKPLEHYIAHLRKSRHSEKTVLAIVHSFKKFHDWLRLSHDVDPWSASEKMARDYLALATADIFKVHQPLDRLYHWAQRERYLLSNPFERIGVSMRRARLMVCSEEQIKKVQAFIKSTRSNSEAAMMLALVFFWGVTCKEMTFATIETDAHKLKIIFHRGALTCGNSRYRRDQVLCLPDGPAWLMDLQRRFIKDWRARFRHVNVDLPRQPLILHPRARHNRPISTLCARKIYYQAVEAATGLKIPPNVLRRAGADYYTRQNATGLLSRFGWSKSRAFGFTWMPRELYQQTTLSK